MSVRRWCIVGLTVWSVANSGCALLHELQPHRLRRLNRVPPPHLDPEFTKTDFPAAMQPLILRAQNQ
jgi:hypothetical protein